MPRTEDTQPVRFAVVEEAVAATAGHEELLPIPLYHQKILQRGHCQSFLPTTFLSWGPQSPPESPAELLVDTEEYLPLWEHRQRKAKSRWLCLALEMLTTIELLLEVIKDNEEHLFFPEQYLISRDTVYVHSKRQEVRLYYQPTLASPATRKNGEGPALVHQLANFLRDLEQEETDKEWLFYSQHLRREMEQNNLGMKSLLRLVRHLKEEAGGIRWDQDT